MAEPPMPRMGSVWPVLPNFRVGNLPLSEFDRFFSGGRGLGNALAQGRRAGGRQ